MRRQIGAGGIVIESLEGRQLLADVTGLTLINAATDRVIGPLTTGATIDLKATGNQLSVRAEVSPSTATGSAVFTLDGTRYAVENLAPYAIKGNAEDDYHPWTPSIGSHTLKVVHYTGSNGTGTAGRAVTVSFRVTGGTTVTPSTPKVAWTSTSAPRAPVYRTESQIVQVGSKVYAIGGFTSGSGLFPVTKRVHSFDMATGTWKEHAPLPTGAPTTHGGTATDGRYIYLVAGQVGSGYGPGTNRSYRYDTQSNTWTRWVDLPQVRFGGALSYHDGNLYYFGGDKSDRKTTSTDHWMIDLSNTSAGWVKKASLPLAGDHMSHAVINGIIYAIGGEHGHHGTNVNEDSDYIQHKYLFAYNPASNTWTRKADMPIASSHFEGGTYVVNGKIVLVGGLLTGGGKNTTAAVRFYDPATNKWTSVSGSYPKRIIGQTGGYWNGRIYSTNGYSPDSEDNQKAYWGTVSGI